MGRRGSKPGALSFHATSPKAFRSFRRTRLRRAPLDLYALRAASLKDLKRRRPLFVYRSATFAITPSISPWG